LSWSLSTTTSKGITASAGSLQSQIQRLRDDIAEAATRSLYAAPPPPPAATASTTMLLRLFSPGMLPSIVHGETNGGHHYKNKMLPTKNGFAHCGVWFN
jgi:hypothetical protein